MINNPKPSMGSTAHLVELFHRTALRAVRRFGLWSLFFLCLPATFAQVSRIPHVTSATGGFGTELILTNLGDQAQNYRLTAYATDGALIDHVEGLIGGGVTVFETASTFFGSDQVSHIEFTPSDTLEVGASYSRIEGSFGRAHVQATGEASTGWRFFPGNLDVTWDGLAVINTGDSAADVVLTQFNANGAALRSETIIPSLAPNAKGLFVVPNTYPNLDEAFFEVSSAQRLAFVALRGNHESTFLWENSALPVTPSDTTVSACNPESSLRKGVFLLGHSLVGFEMPWMLDGMALADGQQHTQEYAFINGAPLKWTWTHAADAQGANFEVELPSGNYDTLVLTEGLPITNHITDSVQYAPLFYGKILEGNADAQLYVYQTWPEIIVDDWYGELNQWRMYWEQIADAVETAHPGKTVYIVPAGPALAELRRRIEAGQVPGISEIRGTIFFDDIHMTRLGNYFIAMVHYATLYKRCPSQMKREFDGPYGEPDWLTVPEDLRAVFEDIAWQIVSGDARSGVR
ncbi:hypothetical protein SCOR_10295 [Sulfidibacter corallicola]|uniref:Uncharacterized protein n=1 Tax=Sulfidibacter corallicola TaxID=2818388 RepID=A0A8A4TFE5_SULCO|nr:hypothetical protein [Sulfidibacter corallicola]QTD48270.1 hypothetical protein J3U87_22020 [Sulfidibacter corallicola]